MTGLSLEYVTYIISSIIQHYNIKVMFIYFLLIVIYKIDMKKNKTILKLLNAFSVLFYFYYSNTTKLQVIY